MKVHSFYTDKHANYIDNLIKILFLYQYNEMNSKVPCKNVIEG